MRCAKAWRARACVLARRCATVNESAVSVDQLIDTLHVGHFDRGLGVLSMQMISTTDAPWRGSSHDLPCLSADDGAKLATRSGFAAFFSPGGRVRLSLAWAQSELAVVKTADGIAIPLDGRPDTGCLVATLLCAAMRAVTAKLHQFFCAIPRSHSVSSFSPTTQPPLRARCSAAPSC